MRMLKSLRAKITRLFKKKPKKVSLMELIKQVESIANEYKEDYYSLRAEIKYYNQNEPPTITLYAYINGFTHVEGKNIDEICKKMREYKTRPEVENKIADVLI